MSSDDLGILFLHHNVNEIALNNLKSIRRYNHGATIVTMSAGKIFPGGYTLESTPDVKQMHEAAARRSSDRLVCSWYLQRKESRKKWWIVEWDTFCTVSARQYYAPVWQFPFVASTVCLRSRYPEWHWFKKVGEMQEDYRPYAIGAVPFLYLLDQVALEEICQLLIEEPLVGGNGELRFATAANRCGYAPCGYSPPNDQITWMRLSDVSNQPAIFHSIKHCVDSSQSSKG